MFGFKEFFSKFSSKFLAKKKFVLILVFLVIIAGIFIASAVLADGTTTTATPAPEEVGVVTRFLAGIIETFVSFAGGILLLEVKILIMIVGYNEFLKSTAVTNGWVIVRDLCNMFFIVVLLAIAIATILKIEMYHYKKLLGRLLIMAILINFSKTICGLVIDFAQVLMMTFVNGFSAAAGGNFVEALKLDKIMQIEPGQEVNGAKILGAYLLALLMIIVSCVVVGVMIAVFLMRIVMLWILIVLSPAAYLLSTFPQGQKYAAQWWSQFGNYVIVGPVLAFFLWLSLLSVSTLSSTDVPPPLAGEENVEQRVAISKVAGEQEMFGFIIAIGMLIGGLVITQQMGVMGSSLAGGAVAGMRKYGMAAIKAPASWAGKKAGQYYNRGADIMYGRTGLALPGSKLRKEFKEEREKALHLDRRYKGQVVSADRVAGQRYGIAMAAATLMDPGLARKVGTFGVLGMIPKRDQAVAGMKRYAELQGKRAEYARMAEDPVGVYQKTLDHAQKREAGLAVEAEKEAKGLEKENKEKFDKIKSSEGKEENLVQAISDLTSKIDKLEVERGEYEKATPEDLIKKLVPSEKDAKEQISMEERRVWEDKAYRKKIRDESEKAGYKPDTSEAREFMSRRGREEAVRRVAGRLGTEEIKKITEKKETSSKEKENKEKDLEKVRIVLDTAKKDKTVKKVMDLRVKMEEHDKKAEEMEVILKLAKGKPEERKEFEEKAKEHFKELSRTASCIGAISSISTPELQTHLGKIQVRAKELLTKELGREPAEEELKRKLAEMTKKMEMMEGIV
jgi:hypothetical protein